MDSNSSLRYMVNHVFLPPRLPQKDDSSIGMDFELSRQFHAALLAFQRLDSHNRSPELAASVAMAHNITFILDERESLDPKKLEIVLANMKVKDVLAIQIHAQNAGFIIRKEPDKISFESFELSPTTASVMGSKGRLIRSFPGPAIGVDSERITDPTFRDALIQLLVQLDTETLKESIPTVHKAGSKTTEIRDTVHPKLVTEMLTGILRGIGEPIEMVRLQKHTRDDVLWKEALKPWRRSPLWLLLRVALQTTLMGKARDHAQYKSFMLFFMARLLEQATKARFPSHTLFVMAAKIGRRALKLGVSEEDIPWVKYIHTVVEGAHQELSRLWNLRQENPDPNNLQEQWHKSEMSFDRDTQLSLRRLGPYLANISNRSRFSRESSEHNPECLSRVNFNSTDLPDQGFLSRRQGYDLRLCLMDIEQWVQNHLKDWALNEQNLQSQYRCIELSDLIGSYESAAASAYEGNAEDISQMLLTLLQLWVAFDKCATRQFPLLRKYEPGFPKNLFDPLLLPYKVQMECLSEVELYIATRREEAVHSSSLIFEDVNKAQSFAVQYFEQSVKHQALRQKILNSAREERTRKETELSNKKRNYSQLIQQASSKAHENTTRWNRKKKREYLFHDQGACAKCALEREAKNLRIRVHEWPLPAYDLDAKSAVFELDVPKTISKWRDTTYKLLVDVFSPRRDALWRDGSQKYMLKAFNGLTSHIKNRTGRLQYASRTKSFLDAHYREKAISEATKGNICVNHGLSYLLCDETSGEWTSKLLGQCDIQKLCTLQLPSGTYKSLQWAVDGTTHTTNQVLARQSECPRQSETFRALDPHEFYAFGALRSGFRLQWRNIARELFVRTLNFNHGETYLLVVQAAWQAGLPNKEICRETHVDLEEETFGMDLISVLETALSTVEANWQSTVAVRTFVSVAIRLLSVSPHNTIHTKCFTFLRRARTLVLAWAHEVSTLAHESQDGDQLISLNLRVLELFMLCQETYYVDQKWLSELLKSSEDVAIFIECCIGIRDRCPAETTNMSQHLRCMLRHHEKLTKMAECELRYLILRDPVGINSAIHQVWGGYRPGSSWSGLPMPAERWVTTRTEDSTSSMSSVAVHYNILDGTLLVNALPLTRLPRHYELHESFKRLFGNKVLDVIPSTMTGMEFETRSEIYGRQVHFHMCKTELIIKSKTQERIEEFIPITAIIDDLPRAFVYDHVHWLDVNTGEIEWRPLEDPWRSSQENWRMKKNPSLDMVLCSGDKKVIDVHSATARAVSQILSPLEKATHIHVILDSRTGEVEINLPRMKLDFSLKKASGLLESNQFRGMIVDENQSFGAFTGLVNKLVLHEPKTRARTVLVPHGSVSFETDHHHIKVKIGTGSHSEVKYYAYQIDKLLGRLLDNGSLQSRLFKLYLHAMTSHCLIDKLTGRTGTEEALDGLRSGSTRSFVKLEPQDVELLQKLADLTPRHEFYPKHLKVMQEVHWRSISPLSQHSEFYTTVAAIVNQARMFQVFQEHPAQLEDLNTCGDLYLLERAAIRESSFQVDGFGAEKFSQDHDTVYHARDQSIDASRELQTFQTSRLVDNWSTNLTVTPNLLSEIESWPGELIGPEPEEELSLNFDIRWLEAQQRWFSSYWCALQKWLSRSVDPRDKYKILFLLSALSYSTQANKKHIRTLLAFATVPELQNFEAPGFSAFRLEQGYQPSRQALIMLIRAHARKFHECPESDLKDLEGETSYEADARRQDLYESARTENVSKFADQLMSQWPTASVSSPVSSGLSEYIDVEKAMRAVRPSFENWHRNSMFQLYIQRAQKVLDRVSPESLHSKEYSIKSIDDTIILKKSFVDFHDLMETPNPTSTSIPPLDFGDWLIPGITFGADHSKLDILLRRISSESSNAHEQKYAEDLRSSFEALPTLGPTTLKPINGLDEVLRQNLNESRQRVEEIYQVICANLQDAPNSLLRKACLLPRICPTSILSHLAHGTVDTIKETWKQRFVEYGLAITVLQRAERLITSTTNNSELLSEMENAGHQDWDPMCYTEWLLLEIENNILIRREQAQIGQEMMSPSSGSNSVMQLNMGLGKSSVIVPIVSASLADTTKLVRVIVLKPLAMQMFQLLAKKLGGMINRRVLYMPLSRSLTLDAFQARQIREMYLDCMSNGSILLLQPEHILSFELMGLDKLLAGDTDAGEVMIETQDWLYQKSRDILDESDEILSVRFELIYTMGEQRPIELAPDRWGVVQHVLGVIGCAANKIFNQFPDGLELIPRKSGAFPKLRIIQSAAGEELLKIVAQQLLHEGLSGLPSWTIRDDQKASLFNYLTDPSNVDDLGDFEHWSATTKSILLLLRGLFGNGILRFAFEQKRWRVNYGLDLSRSMLAVPFHAKDIPAPRAEFSHPDATIVLTCLTYYYTGLSDDQIRLCIQKLLQFDSPDEEFNRWVRDAPELGSEFGHIGGINLSNSQQCLQKVFPPLRLAKAIIDFYLTFVVFPAEMREFPEKLSSSGWDIAREKENGNPTTGFSGTNDSRYVLPLSISQRDLPDQLSTNAMVLNTLLRPENAFKEINEFSSTGLLNAEVLLKMVVELEPKIRVILDVGAQVEEMQNEDVAREWLAAIPAPEAKAAIFFDHLNEICVLSRDGRKESLQTSSFATQMDQCLVYLDESHTRGTDLTLPKDYRALVTLGPNLPKDRLVQACMRMRKLGKGQSVLMCASMEIQRKILDSNRKPSGPIEVLDVLRWVISETCFQTRRSIPLWATQGLRHQHRRAVYSGGIMTADLAATLREPEAQTLEQRYGIRTDSGVDPFVRSMNDREPGSREQQIKEIQAKCKEFEIRDFDSATLHEEQERELSPENEREQQVELPPPAKPLDHELHPDVKQMVIDGRVNRLSSSLKPAFETFDQTTASDFIEARAWPRDLLVTIDFGKTVQVVEKGLDLFLRPVHWILSCHGWEAVEYVVLSPFEVQSLLPLIRQSKYVALHIYAARTNKVVQTLETLSFCAIPAVPETVPSLLVRQLNLFAGQLYILNYQEYEELCGLLGLSHGEGNHVETDSDGFVKPKNRGVSSTRAIRECRFQTNQIPFLAKMINFRRKGHSIAASHMGKILKGELVGRDQFEELKEAL